MNGQIYTQVIVVNQIQAERRAAADAQRVAADWRGAQAARGPAQPPVPWPQRRTAPVGALRPVARP